MVTYPIKFPQKISNSKLYGYNIFSEQFGQIISGVIMDKFYVKKPLRIKAFRYGFDEIPEWCLKDKTVTHVSSYAIDYILISTLDGEVKAMPGDYVLQGIQGEIYPCKSDIFMASYNLAPDLIEEDFI